MLKEVGAVPNGLHLSPWSEFEFKFFGPESRGHYNQHTWVLEGQEGETLMVAGIYNTAIIGGVPELWLLICEDFKLSLRRNLRIVRDHMRYLLSLYPNVRVRVDAECPLGQKFAEFMGFKLRSRETWHNEREYLVLEVTT